MGPTCPKHSRSTLRRAGWVGGVLLLALTLGCDAESRAGGGNEPTHEVAAVAIDSEPLVGTRIGQRWRLA